MFKEEWATLVRVTLQARLLILETGVNHVRPPAHFPGRTSGPMRVMAIRAGHEAFVHAVFERQSKLSANVVVAPITNIRLSFRQEGSVGLGLVNGVAGSTTDAGLRMITAADVGAIGVLCVTTQTGIHHLGWGQFRERNNTLFAAHRIDVLLAGSMAPLTPGVLNGDV